MSSDMIFIDTYSCPQCRAELESGLVGWQGWQQCPTCGLPSLPPHQVSKPDRRRDGAGPSASNDVLVISDSPENIVVADPTGTADGGRPSYVSGARLILRTGLVVSIGLAFIFFLDRRTTNTLIFAFLAFVFFVLLARAPAPQVDVVSL